MSSPGVSANPTSAPTPAGLINSAPGSITTTPGATPTGNSGPGAPVTSYNPAQATASGITSAPTQVPDNARAVSQLNDIIASGSPLMQQAETNARNQMNQRGLINSSIGVTADQAAVISAATPLAQQDAQTYATAAQQSAAAENAARQQTAQMQTSTSQYNAGQSNAALSQAATASNTVAQTAQTIAGQTTIQGMQGAVQQFVAQLQASTSMSNQDKQDATQQLIAAIQSNTSMSNQDKQDATNTLITQMNNAEALQAIQAQGTINTQIAQLNDQYGQLTASDQAAQQFYTQGLANLVNIINNTNLNDAQKTQALNDGVQELNDGLATISRIAGTPGVQSTLNFTGATTDPVTGQLAA